jgi:hypothetical protein
MRQLTIRTKRELHAPKKVVNGLSSRQQDSLHIWWIMLKDPLRALGQDALRHFHRKKDCKTTSDTMTFQVTSIGVKNAHSKPNQGALGFDIAKSAMDD